MRMLQAGRARVLFVALWLVALAVLTALYLSPTVKPPSPYHTDKILHALGFFAATAPAMLAFLGRAGRMAALVVMAAFAIGLEHAQAYVPGRDFTYFDIVANGVGITIAALAERRLSRRRGFAR